MAASSTQSPHATTAPEILVGQTPASTFTTQTLPGTVLASLCKTHKETSDTQSEPPSSRCPLPESRGTAGCRREGNAGGE